MLLDIRLGEIDGLTFFRKMQADGFAVPTVFISGNATLTEAAQAVKIGAFDFVEKPFSAERIVVAVKRCLELSAIKERLRLIEEQRPAPQIVGDSAGNPATRGRRRPCGGDARERAHHRREWHWQGARGEHDPCEQRPLGRRRS